MSDLDLETGDEERVAKIAETEARKTKRSRTGDKNSSSHKRSGNAGSERGDTDLIGRLVAAFDRLAEQREARGDSELADAIREDQQAMSRGLVSLTRAITFLRVPLLVLLSFLEPIMAFWHVGGILARRFVERRQRVMAEREMAAAETEIVPNGGTAVA